MAFNARKRSYYKPQDEKANYARLLSQIGEISSDENDKTCTGNIKDSKVRIKKNISKYFVDCRIMQPPVIERTENFLDTVIQNFEQTKHQATDEAEKLLLLLKIFQGSYQMIRKDPSLFNMIFKQLKKGKFGKRHGPGQIQHRADWI